MKTVLLDTNIVIYILNEVPYADLYAPYLEGVVPVISFMTVAELYEGAFRAGANTKMYRKIIEAVARYYIIPFDERVGKFFGKIRAERRNKPISVPDALIAATAMAYDLSLITHNADDFLEIPDLDVITKYVKKEK
jgi:predicted nucleic acid-binding protein